MPHDFETPQILHDAPLRAADQHHFHFDEFAVTLARLIASKDTRTPLTIGVSGAWGSGKTTLLRRVREQLDATVDLADQQKPALLKFQNDQDDPQTKFRVCRTVWFDAWKYAGEDQLLAALLRVIVLEMQASGFWDQIKAELAKPKKTEVKWLGLLLNALTHFASAGSYDVNLSDYEVDTPLKAAAAFFDYFDVSLNRLLASWISGHIVGNPAINERDGVLVVFIDDLDRCLPEKTVQILEAIKLFLDKPGCVFVLGADTRIVQAAVVDHYKDAGVTGEEASDYLEKIMQLRFELPPIVEKQMGDYLGVAKDVVDATVLSNWRTIIAGAEINPRKVKTFVNDLNLRWAMLKNTGQATDVNRDDFIRWQVLMRVAPPDFVQRVIALPIDLRRKFIDDALKWVRGDQSVADTFRSYDGSVRLKRVLSAIRFFSDQFTAEVLDGFVHLAAPLQVSPADAQPAPTGAPGTGIEAGTKQVLGRVQFAYVPKGRFVMGSRADNLLAFSDERPQHIVDIPYGYWIARYPVTNEQFAVFVEAMQYQTTAEKEGGWSSEAMEYVEGFNWRHPLGTDSDIKRKGSHPVVQISWHDAVRYCEWLTDKLHDQIGTSIVRLATEAEWEKAARGEYGNEWPWGNEFDPEHCNSAESDKDTTTQGGIYSPQGDSPYSVADMAGNVWEWCRSIARPYPYQASAEHESEILKTVERIMRGGSYLQSQGDVRTAVRDWFPPDTRDRTSGFRIVIAPALA